MNFTEEFGNRLSLRLVELAKTYKVACMNPTVYAFCRKYGRDVMEPLVSHNEGKLAPGAAFALKTGIQGAVYSCDLDFDGDYMDSMFKSPHFKQDVHWILTVTKMGIADNMLLVAKELGDPWETVEI